MNYRGLVISLGVVCLLCMMGCSVDNDTVTSYTEEQYDVSTGLTLEPSTNMWVTFPEMVAIYKKTEACLNYYTYGNGPIVAYHDIGDVWGIYDPIGSWSIAYGVRDEQIPYSIIISNPDKILYNDRDKRTDTEVLAHEYIHHILLMNGMDYHHSNPLFSKCGVGVNTYN